MSRRRLRSGSCPCSLRRSTSGGPAHDRRLWGADSPEWAGGRGGHGGPRALVAAAGPAAGPLAIREAGADRLRRGLTMGPTWYACPHTKIRYQLLARVREGVDVIDEYGNRRVVNAQLWDKEMIPC